MARDLAKALHDARQDVWTSWPRQAVPDALEMLDRAETDLREGEHGRAASVLLGWRLLSRMAAGGGEALRLS